MRVGDNYFRVKRIMGGSYRMECGRVWRGIGDSTGVKGRGESGVKCWNSLHPLGFTEEGGCHPKTTKHKPTLKPYQRNAQRVRSNRWGQQGLRKWKAERDTVFAVALNISSLSPTTRDLIQNNLLLYRTVQGLQHGKPQALLTQNASFPAGEFLFHIS